MHWELWDNDTANLVDTFETEDEALQGVRDLLAVNTPDYVEELSLGAMYDEGESPDVELPPVLNGEILKARLAEMTQDAAADASRAVHEQIRKWLAEENWHVEDVPVPPESFNVVALQRDGRAVNIFQGNDHLDHVTLSLRGLHDLGIRQVISRLPESDLRDVLWTIYRDVSMMGVECYGLDTPVNEMVLRTSLYFDGLSKDVLMQRIHLVNRAYRLAIRTLVHALEARSHTDENILSPDELTKIRHLPPAAGDGPLTVAS
jgi:hypothetical protein